MKTFQFCNSENLTVIYFHFSAVHTYTHISHSIIHLLFIPKITHNVYSDAFVQNIITMKTCTHIIRYLLLLALP